MGGGDTGVLGVVVVEGLLGVLVVEGGLTISCFASSFAYCATAYVISTTIMHNRMSAAGYEIRRFRRELLLLPVGSDRSDSGAGMET